MSYKTIPVSDLKLSFTNTAISVQDLMLSLKVTNAVRPLCVDSKEMLVLNGHNRCHALKSLGFKKIPYWDVSFFDCQFRDIQSNKILDSTAVYEDIKNGRLLDPDRIEVQKNGVPLSILEPYDLVSLDFLKIKVFTVGVFDLFHIGHLNFLKNARLMGEHLTVGVQFNAHKYKDQKIYTSFNDRFFIVQSLRFVDISIPYENVAETIHKVTFDIFAFGPDQNNERFAAAFDFCKSNGKKIVKIPRTDGISSSDIRQSFAKNGI